MDKKNHPDTPLFFDQRDDFDAAKALGFLDQVEADLETILILMGRSVLLHDRSIGDPLAEYLKKAHQQLSATWRGE